MRSLRSSDSGFTPRGYPVGYWLAVMQKRYKLNADVRLHLYLKCFGRARDRTQLCRQISRRFHILNRVSQKTPE
jgi:hypothetical protein